MTIRSLVGASTGTNQSRFSILSANPGVLNGAMESIATVTVGSGGASSIEFTSIPQTYQHLQVRLISRDTKTSTSEGYLRLRMNGNTANYVWHELTGNGSSAFAGSGVSGQDSIFAGYHSTNGATSGIFGTSIIDILDYSNSSKTPTVRILNGTDKNGSGTVTLFSGFHTTAAAVTSLLFLAQSWNFAQHTTAALYGIKAP